jgi:hypothetical protein
MSQITASIPSGATGLSGGVNLNGLGLVRLDMPDTWATASLTFQVSRDGGTYADYYDDTGAEVTVAAAASRSIAVDVTKFVGVQWLKIRSGTGGAPVNQNAQRDIVLIARSLS